ncbi:MAG: HPF/RaiA family ribosome-associated protein [Nitrosomonas sp.]|uniref:HPF/RaiA family ribosome-associated protein n=1 Tax=Nitrosomonas sp. TaxID=42353 RepID=UPI002719DD69|nr:HPF/RaiA family ribosome-associated protein [Nitrosomonas sp.]MDO8893869.1 HPF/RaiA family ribosome-associated protein [Nitrosomonas sp.]MDO9470671.1 HPF/RaiA family ribosome-associated protein [Nitrosomonas sp.]MDP1787153.1 HPF/RaiA family ribosome-associated protein [Nitrosomonas sp.]MDP2225247.1 HPF/RaiA family ribosome-associated protein [Nitrosomonas sp.]
MHIQINTDSNVEGHEKFSNHAKSIVEGVLKHFNDHITRIEVHISDVNSDKGGINDKRCLIEARLQGQQPIAVTEQAENLEQAIRGAAEKLKNMIGSNLGRRDNYPSAPAPSQDVGEV